MTYHTVCYVIWGDNIGRENQIIRTTLYLESHLHTKAREAGINLSKEVATYLETILFGDDVGDVQYQLHQVDAKIESITIELASLKTRREQLLNMINEHDAKTAADQSIYNKFLSHVSNILSNEDKGFGIDFNRLKHHWKRDYFSGNNGLSDKTVKTVLYKVKKKDFVFDDFQQLRRGANLENQ